MTGPKEVLKEYRNPPPPETIRRNFRRIDAFLFISCDRVWEEAKLRSPYILLGAFNFQSGRFGTPVLQQTCENFGCKSIALELPQRCVDFVWLCSIAGLFRRAMTVFKFSLFSGNKAKPRERPPKGSETGLNPL